MAKFTLKYFVLHGIICMGGDEMQEYKEMYFTLFNRVTDVIEQLKAAQKEAEDIFIYKDEIEQAQKKSNKK